MVLIQGTKISIFAEKIVKSEVEIQNMLLNMLKYLV